jgi:hypothetical protein
MWLYHPEKSVTHQHSIYMGYHIHLNDADILARKFTHRPRYPGTYPKMNRKKRLSSRVQAQYDGGRAGVLLQQDNRTMHVCSFSLYLAPKGIFTCWP